MNSANKTRRTCSICGKILISGIDPQRKHPKNYFIGKCRQCTSDMIVIKKWLKRNDKEIKEEIKTRYRNIDILKTVLDLKKSMEVKTK